MKVLVTGAAGYIGKQTVLELQARDIDYVTLDIVQDGTIDYHMPYDNIDPHSSLLNGVTDIIHLAASSSVPKSVSDPFETYENNVVRMSDLLADLSISGKFIFASSAAVYSNGTEHQNAYGASKAFGETMLRDWTRVGLTKAVALRYFNVAGADLQLRAGPTWTDKHLIPVALRSSKDYPLEVFTAPEKPNFTCIRDYVHVVDVARLNVDMLFFEQRKAFEVFDVGHGSGLSFPFLCPFFKKYHDGFAYEMLEASRPGDVECLIADIRRLIAETGWIPVNSNPENIIKSNYEWYKTNFADKYKEKFDHVFN
jgi:UDP-glucose 4-epimerase